MSSALEVSGTPTTFGSGTATVTVTDADGDTATLGFGWRVTLAAPSYLLVSGSATNATGAYTVSWGFSGGATSYELQEQSDAGAWSTAHTGAGRSVTFTDRPNAVYAYRARACADGYCGEWSETDEVTVVRPDMPSFADVTVADQLWVVDEAIEPFTLPAAAGGDAPLSYAIDGLPGGFTMSGGLELTGTPTALGSGTATLTATDTDGDTASLRFGWTVETDARPSFGGAVIANRTWVVGEPITGFTAPTATGGNGALLYGEDGLPDGVRLVQDTWVVEGAPTLAGTGTAAIGVWDVDKDLDVVSFDWTVEADLSPSFDLIGWVPPWTLLGASADASSSSSGSTWVVGEPITAFTLPAATGGNGTLSYGASGLPEGVIVSPERVVSGTPLATGSGTAALTARDGDGDTVAYRFRWQVEAPGTPPAGSYLSVSRNPTTGADFVVQGLYLGRNRLDKIDCVEGFLEKSAVPSRVWVAIFERRAVACEGSCCSFFGCLGRQARPRLRPTRRNCADYVPTTTTNA